MWRGAPPPEARRVCECGGASRSRRRGESVNLVGFLPNEIHRLASPPAAARTATFTGSPRLRLRLAPPPSATLAHAVELQEVRRSRHPHGRAGDDDEDVARPDRPVAKERRLDLLDHLVGRLNLADEPR